VPKIISECRELVKLCDINIVVVRFFYRHSVFYLLFSSWLWYWQ